MHIHITYLESYTRRLNQLADELTDMQTKYKVTVDIDQAQDLSEVLARLKTIIDDMPIV